MSIEDENASEEQGSKQQQQGGNHRRGRPSGGNLGVNWSEVHDFLLAPIRRDDGSFYFPSYRVAAEKFGVSKGLVGQYALKVSIKEQQAAKMAELSEVKDPAVNPNQGHVVLETPHQGKSAVPIPSPAVLAVMEHDRRVAAALAAEKEADLDEADPFAPQPPVQVSTPVAEPPAPADVDSVEEEEEAEVPSTALEIAPPRFKKYTPEDMQTLERLLVYGIRDSNASGGLGWKYPTYEEIGAKLGMSKGYISQIVRKNNIVARREAVRRERARIINPSGQDIDAILDDPSNMSGLTADQAVRVANNYIAKFGQALAENKVDVTNPIHFERMVRLRSFLKGDADSRRETKVVISMEDLQAAYSKNRERAISSVSSGILEESDAEIVEVQVLEEGDGD